MSGCMSAMGGMGQVELAAGLQQLKSEHPPLLEQLAELYAITQQINEGTNVEENFAALIGKVQAFKVALDPHSEREEGVLFPMIGAYIGTTSGPIAVMEYEHDQAKSNIGAFLAHANASQTIEEKKQLTELIKNAYLILTEHFGKEENVLFPMAQRMLTDEEKEELLTRINEIK